MKKLLFLAIVLLTSCSAVSGSMGNGFCYADIEASDNPVSASV